MATCGRNNDIGRGRLQSSMTLPSKIPGFELFATAGRQLLSRQFKFRPTDRPTVDTQIFFTRKKCMFHFPICQSSVFNVLTRAKILNYFRPRFSFRFSCVFTVLPQRITVTEASENRQKIVSLNTCFLQMQFPVSFCWRS